MRKKNLILSLMMVTLLCSCADTSELYPNGAFVRPTFTENVFRVHEGATKEAKATPKTTKVLQNERNGYFNGSGKVTSLDGRCEDSYGFAQAKLWHPDYFKEGSNNLYWGYNDGHSDIVGAYDIQWVDQSSLYGVVYSQTKKLVRNYPKFSKGILSKLYNGQIMCDHWSYFAMTVLSQEGYGTLFPYELEKATYFALSLRGGSDIDQPRLGTEMNGRILSFDIDVSFFKLDASNRLIAENVTLSSVYLQANRSSNLTSLVGFTFADAGINPAGIVGMAVTPRLTGDAQFEVGTEVTDDFNDKEKGHDGLCVLEVLFPDSTWN